MGADVSRVRFDPLRDFAGVVLGQGRLLLDADFNELVALLDRRLRAHAVDLTSFGPDPARAGVAWVPRQTPDAFRVGVSAGALSIGRGRMYVDGLVAENHGGAPQTLDPLLAEPTGTADAAYDPQPYWPAPDSLSPGGPHLAYLDVWRREVTHLEDPGLVEVAVGVDTSARWQTAWQVRLLADVGSDVTCASADADIPGWLDVIRPSDGRLSSGSVPVDDDDDPCALPPTGGYRGLENQTYRVEIHAGGEPGTATFTWSRDNASVAMPVVEPVSATVLRLASVGRDDVLRISSGDWVEILDDRRELSGAAGEMRRVTVDDAARTIAFAPALPAELVAADAAEAADRHLRVRRWDASGRVRDAGGTTLIDLDAPGATGLVTVPSDPTTQVVLEHGIVVSFDVTAPGGRFRAGDHWIFAARSATTSVEALRDAPPLGVHHHHARLGLVTFPDAATDCRQHWPPLATGDGDCGDCTVCVTPETHASGALTVQAAVDGLAGSGGTICLSTGVYDLGKGLRVEGARSLRIRGQGPATILAARGAAIEVRRSLAVTLERLAVVSGRAARAAIRLHATAGVTLQDLAVLSFGADAGGGGGAAVELAGVCVLTSLRRNVLVGASGVSVGGEREVGIAAAGVRIEDNLVIARDRGIDLGGRSAYLHDLRVGGNDILGAREAAIVATGMVGPPGILSITGNRIAATGAGIHVGVDATVAANTVTGLRDDPGGDGVVVLAGGLPAAAGHVRITDNRLHDRDGVGIALRAPVATATIAGNLLERVDAGIAVQSRGRAEHLAIEGNGLRDVGPRRERAGAGAVAGAAVGISALRCTSVTIAGNSVVGVGRELVEGLARIAIIVGACQDARVSANLVDEVGPERYVGLAAGIVVLGPFDRLLASENSVRRGPLGVTHLAPWHAVMVLSPGRGELGVGERRATVPLGAGALALTGAWAAKVARGLEHVTLSANTLTGGGARATALVRVDGDVVLDANQCEHLQAREPAGLLVEAGSVTAATNRVRGERAMLVLEVRDDRFAALGNLTAGGVHLGGPGAGLPAPWDALNPIVA